MTGTRGRVNVPIRGRLTINNLDGVRRAAIEGCGLALLPSGHCRADLESGRLQRVLPGLCRQAGGMWVVYPRTHFMSAKVCVSSRITFRQPLRRSREFMGIVLSCGSARRGCNNPLGELADPSPVKQAANNYRTGPWESVRWPLPRNRPTTKFDGCGHGGTAPWIPWSALPHRPACLAPHSLEYS